MTKRICPKPKFTVHELQSKIHLQVLYFIFQLLTDSNMPKLRQGLKQTDSSQKETRLEELRLMRNLWKQKGEKDSTDHMNLLKVRVCLIILCYIHNYYTKILKQIDM